MATSKFTPYVIGITGMTGCGKTYVVNYLLKKFKANITALSQDNYYKDAEKIGVERWERANYDTPDAFDNELLVKHLETLKAGKSIESPLYDFKTHDRSAKTVKIEPKQIILLEGLFILTVDLIRRLIDFSVYLEADDDVRLARRLLRDLKERGRTTESNEQTIGWYLSNVKPMQEKYIMPQKEHANSVMDSTDGGQRAADDIETEIEKVFLMRKS